jgi:hypothetical protein
LSIDGSVGFKVRADGTQRFGERACVQDNTLLHLTKELLAYYYSPTVMEFTAYSPHGLITPTFLNLQKAGERVSECREKAIKKFLP